MKKALKKDIKKDNRLNKFRGKTHKMVEKGKMEYDRAIEMRLNRVSYKRFEEEINRGYDLVSNQKGNTISSNLDHVRPKKIGSGYGLLENRTIHATADTRAPIHYAQGSSAGVAGGSEASMTNMDSNRHITGSNMSDRRLTNRTTDSADEFPASNTQAAHHATVTPRSKEVLYGSARPATTGGTSGNKSTFRTITRSLENRSSHG